MDITKGQEFSLEIDDMGTDGEGIGHKEGYTLFVKDVLVGDIVRVKVIKAKKKYGYGRLMEVLQPSPWRVEPVCKCARPCGGCQIQHCSYERQLEWKEKKVRDCLERIGGFEKIPMEPILGMDRPYHYRNKAQYPVGYDREGNLVAGFYAGRTHSIIPNTDCAIQHPCNHVILETILDFMRKYDIPAYREEQHTGLVRHILTRVGRHTGQIMVCLVINGNKLPHEEKLVESLLQCPVQADISGENGAEKVSTENIESVNQLNYEIKSICLNINKEKTNRILGKKIVPIYGQSYIEDRIGNITYRISPLSFYQVNPVQTEKLYSTALEYADLHGNEVVWDLYCGIGTISLFLAQKASKVCGVEIIAQAIEDARDNAKRNGFTNTEFFVGAAEEVVPEQYEKSKGSLRADVVTLDPPRKGCDEKLLQTVVQMKPDRIVYVSCDPATLARDLKYLCGTGYELKKVRACDMFGHSSHVEAVCLLSKLHETKHHVNVRLDMDEMDLTAAESKATYEEIKKYVAEYNDGMKVSNLYIAQVKRKCGIELAENFNIPRSEGAKQLQCPKEKEEAIIGALKAFQMI